MKNNSEITMLLFAVSLVLFARCGNPERDKILIKAISEALESEVPMDMLADEKDRKPVYPLWKATSIEQLEIIEIVHDHSSQMGGTRYCVMVYIKGTCSRRLRDNKSKQYEMKTFSVPFEGERCYYVIPQVDWSKSTSKQAEWKGYAKYSGKECQD